MDILSLGDVYNRYIYEKRDMRTDSLPMMASPLPTLFICLTYVWLVWGLGPRFMKNRPAYDLQGLIVFYNAFQVVLSTFIFYKFLTAGWLFDYDYRCQPVDYTSKGLPMVYAAWWYYISKFTEFPDTFFFVLRKKFSHASVLHVVHHGLMPFSVWWGMKVMPGGHSTFFGLINSLVHIVMYTYYMLAAMGPAYRRYIWWKKYLTKFQMVQFIAIFVHSFQLLFRKCSYPTAGFWYIGAHGVLYFILFSNFYNKEYISKTNVKKRKSIENASEKVSNGNGERLNGNGIANGSVRNGRSSEKVGVSNGSALTNDARERHVTVANGHSTTYGCDS